MPLVTEHITDPYVRAFWLGEYAAYGNHFRAEAISPIQNKIGKALIEPRLRNMLAQPKSTITLRRLMDEGAPTPYTYLARSMQEQKYGSIA